MTFTQRTVVHCMIITTPYASGSRRVKDKRVQTKTGEVRFDIDETSPIPYPSTYERGEEIFRPMAVQKGDRVHALPWAWDKTTVSQFDTFVEHRSGVFHQSANGLIRNRDEIYHINVLPHLNVERTSSLLVPGLPTSTVEMVKSSAILKAQADLRKQVASLPLLFADRKATLRTARSYASFILNNVVTMQRKDVKKWLRALKRQKRPEQLKTLAQQIANRHLEFVFGVLPILGEIEDSVKHFSEPTVYVRTGRGRDRRVTETEHFEKSVRLVKGTFERFPAYGDVYLTKRSDFSARCDLRCEITSQVMNNASLLGFNPFYAWYDMTPLSFVVGWFSNFNTWIQALDPLVGLEYVTGSSSHKDKRTLSKHMEVYPVSNPSSVDVTHYNTVSPAKTPSMSASFDSFVRVVHPTMPGLQDLQFMDRTSFFTLTASISLSIQRLVRNAKREIEVKPFRYRGPKPRNLPPITYKKV